MWALLPYITEHFHMDHFLSLQFKEKENTGLIENMGFPPLVPNWRRFNLFIYLFAELIAHLTIY